MGASILLLSTLLLAPSSSTALPPHAANACLCTQSASIEPCGPERTTCHCVDTPGWTLVRFWAPETSRCEELVFFIMDGDSPSARPQ
jgi:hypothetical protein